MEATARSFHESDDDAEWSSLADAIHEDAEMADRKSTRLNSSH